MGVQGTAAGTTSTTVLPFQRLRRRSGDLPKQLRVSPSCAMEWVSWSIRSRTARTIAVMFGKRREAIRLLLSGRDLATRRKNIDVSNLSGAALQSSYCLARTVLCGSLNKAVTVLVT